jgi:hypothetical protein
MEQKGGLNCQHGRYELDESQAQEGHNHKAGEALWQSRMAGVWKLNHMLVSVLA